MKYILSVFVLSIFSACVSASLMPISKYPGKHRHNCYQGKLTVAQVDNRLYTFGGCYAIPYIVDPNEFDDMGRMFGNNRYNTSNEIHSYDMLTDEWRFEGTTPYPLKQAKIQVVDSTVYFFNMRMNNTRSIDVWSYNVETKVWKDVAKLPFVWTDPLLTCSFDKRIYMTGGYDGHKINIIHVFDTISGRFLNSFVANDHITINKLYCDQDKMTVLGSKIKNKNDDDVIIFSGRHHQAFDLMYIYYNGTIDHLYEDIVKNGSIEKAFFELPWLYTYHKNKENVGISRTNINTFEHETITTLESKISNPYFGVYRNEIYLIGGNSFSNMILSENKDGIKEYNHKYANQEPLVVQG